MPDRASLDSPLDESMKKVVVCQHRLLHYRLSLFERLKETCAARGIEMHLLHGQASRREAVKKDVGSLPWAHVVENRFWEVGERDLVWQPMPADLRDAELIIVMQENRILSNYPLLLSRQWSARRIAYWGHGINFQSDNPKSLRERWKRMMLTRVDWWFAYTELTRDIVRAAGYPEERITVLDNAIDNDSFRADLESVSDEELAALRAKLSRGDTPRIGLFCGSLYPDKRIGYMIEAADRIRAAMPDFMLVIIGDGPSAEEVKSATVTRPWLHWVGVQMGREKAAYFKLASMILNPGLVGLHILDSFCAGVPMVTTADARHSPEIAYLEDNVNGLIVTGDTNKYAEAVIHLLQDNQTLHRLRAGALASAQRYTLANMVERFADGIERCLAMDKKR